MVPNEIVAPVLLFAKVATAVPFAQITSGFPSLFISATPKVPAEGWMISVCFSNEMPVDDVLRKGMKKPVALPRISGLPSPFMSETTTE